MGTSPDEIELTDYQERRIQEIISEEKDLDSTIAQLELKIQTLESEKNDLLKEKRELMSDRQNVFEQIVADDELDVSASGYVYTDGKLVKVEETPEGVGDI